MKEIEITERNGSIIITDNKSCLKQDLVETLRRYGFKTKKPGNLHVLENSSIKKIPGIIEFLKKAGYVIKSNDDITKKLADMEENKKTYMQSVETGNKYKNLKSVKLTQHPPSFNPDIKIKPYQMKPIMHMLDVKHAANFSVPGSGKTLMTYAVYDILKHKRKEIDILLVIGPIASFGPWEDEYEFCMNKNPSRRVLRYHGPNRKNELGIIGKYDVVITSYQTASNDSKFLIRYMLGRKRVMMVIDESHHIKSIEKDAKIANEMIELGKFAKRRYILTGTPVPHSFKDLWSQVTFLWPSIRILFDRDKFRQLLENYRADETISKSISFLWTRVTNKHLKKDLPSVLKEKNYYIQMSKKQEAIYKGIETDFYDTKELDENTIQIISIKKHRILRLMQAASNPSILLYKDKAYDLIKFQSQNQNLNSDIKDYDEVSPKITFAAKLGIKISKEKLNVVIWTVFVKNVEMLSREIRKIDSDSDPIEISGDVPTGNASNTYNKDDANREDRINEFKRSTGRILVATVGSIAESISLHRTCHYAIYLERGFNAGQYMQSLSRIHRINPDKIKKPVQFVFLHSIFRDDKKTTTIDYTIAKKLNDRIRAMHELLNDEFKLHRLNLETNSDEASDADGDDDVGALFTNVEKMIDEHKNAGVI